MSQTISPNRTNPPGPLARRIVFPLAADNDLVLTIDRPMSRDDFDRVMMLVELAKPSLVDCELERGLAEVERSLADHIRQDFANASRSETLPKELELE